MAFRQSSMVIIIHQWLEIHSLVSLTLPLIPCLKCTLELPHARFRFISFNDCSLTKPTDRDRSSSSITTVHCLSTTSHTTSGPVFQHTLAHNPRSHRRRRHCRASPCAVCFSLLCAVLCLLQERAADAEQERFGVPTKQPTSHSLVAPLSCTMANLIRRGGRFIFELMLWWRLVVVSCLHRIAPCLSFLQCAKYLRLRFPFDNRQPTEAADRTTCIDLCMC